jgi:hypothetical protein
MAPGLPASAAWRYQRSASAVAVRTGSEGAAEEPGSLGHAQQPEARGRAGRWAGVTVVPDGEPHAVVVAGDDDMDEGGVACVSERVRDRLLGQAVGLAGSRGKSAG